MKYIEHLFVGGSVKDLDTILYSLHVFAYFMAKKEIM